MLNQCITNIFVLYRLRPEWGLCSMWVLHITETCECRWAPVAWILELEPRFTNWTITEVQNCLLEQPITAQRYHFLAWRPWSGMTCRTTSLDSKSECAWVHLCDGECGFQASLAGSIRWFGCGTFVFRLIVTFKTIRRLWWPWSLPPV
jgi:hypothetical protein